MKRCSHVALRVKWDIDSIDEPRRKRDIIGEIRSTERDFDPTTRCNLIPNLHANSKSPSYFLRFLLADASFFLPALEPDFELLADGLGDGFVVAKDFF